MILFFDTETTGLPPRGAPVDDERQPHIVQLACLLTDEDGAERACVSVIVRPPTVITPDAARIHGISDALASEAGIQPAAAVGIWSQLARCADRLVAHNLPFDLGIMQAAWHRHVADPASAWAEMHGHRAHVCTMRTAQPVVNLPPTDRMRAAGFTGPKAPKLEECIGHFFGEQLAGAHDALVDVRACARVFFHLRSLGAVQ